MKAAGADFSVHTMPFAENPPDIVAELFDSASADSLFYSFPWFQNLVRHSLAADECAQLWVVTGKQGDRHEPRLILPMILRGGDRFWQPVKLTSLANFYTPHFEPISVADMEREEGLYRIASQMATCFLPGADCVNLEPLAGERGLPESIARAFAKAGFWTEIYFRFGNWYLPVSGMGFQHYLQNRPGRLRNTIARKSRQLQRLGAVEFRLVTGLDGLEEMLASYERVYLASWKRPEPFPGFIPGLVRMAAREGWLRLGGLFLDDEPVAMQLWLTANGVASIYKLAYDPRFARYSPGTVLTARMMEHAIDVDRVDEVDYLVGDDDYKQDWMTHRRKRWGVLALNRKTLWGRLLIWRESLAKARRALFHVSG